MADGKSVYEKITDDVLFDKWTQIVLTWSEQQKLQLKIGGDIPVVQYVSVPFSTVEDDGPKG